MASGMNALRCAYSLSVRAQAVRTRSVQVIATVRGLALMMTNMMCLHGRAGSLTTTFVMGALGLPTHADFGQGGAKHLRSVQQQMMAEFVRAPRADSRRRSGHR